MAKNISNILTKDKKHLSIMIDGSGIEADKSLLKYSSIKKEVEEFKKNMAKDLKGMGEEPFINFVSNSMIRDAIAANKDIKKLIGDYEIIKNGDIHTVNLFINKRMFDELFSSNNMKVPFSEINDFELEDNTDGHEAAKTSIFRKLADKLSLKSKDTEDIVVMDVIEFFSRIKGLTKENMDTYVNRLQGYIIALKNCEVTGQTALKEKLLRDMVVNKYESVLYANGMYHVVTEEQVVDFVKKTDKGVRLTYVKNYMRSIPQEAVEKINNLNKLEIFDNYAILHYDPEYKSYGETIAETQRRRDPILFGLIRGSNKLYYITDWIDEYCDLTLDKFVETLQINKDDLKMKDTL